MSKRKLSAGVMLDLWRPPQGAGDAIGCLATTYTFDPGLFDEQCLGRFLEIESEPDREDLAFLLERESRLGGVYAGVLVDHRQAGVEHSLRWDVLRVRLAPGKQHAKLSLLAWKGHVRIIVTSANLTDAGYRVNQEVAGCIDMTPVAFDRENFDDALNFLRILMNHVPAPVASLPEVKRAESFLNQVETLVINWKPVRQSQGMKRRLVFTLPRTARHTAVRSTLDEMIGICRSRGGSPTDVWIASPFFDVTDESSRVTAVLCKSMARSIRRKLTFCVPAIRDSSPMALPRLAAPKALLLVPRSYQSDVRVEMLPVIDVDKIPRPWHAKMISLYGQRYAALLFGSSNFTSAGLGVGQTRNAEANLLVVCDRSMSREIAQLSSIWPEMEGVNDPEIAEWMGPKAELDEEERATGALLPAGFLAATYHAGDHRLLTLAFDPERLPEDWHIYACGPGKGELLSASGWLARGGPAEISLTWTAPDPPHKLLVRWESVEAFLPINVEDTRALPPPTQLQNMTSDDMLMILAAADPSAAFRIWVRQQATDTFDPDLDSATPADLDPLRRYDLRSTFLHRVRRRARILAQVRANLERPIYSRQSLDWRLRGLLGVEALAERLVRDVTNSNGQLDEAILTLADFLIVLREVRYESAEGALSPDDFKLEYDSFLKGLAKRINSQIALQGEHVSDDLIRFWERVLKTCLG